MIHLVVFVVVLIKAVGSSSVKSFLSPATSCPAQLKSLNFKGRVKRHLDTGQNRGESRCPCGGRTRWDRVRVRLGHNPTDLREPRHGKPHDCTDSILQWSYGGEKGDRGDPCFFTETENMTLLELL